jgi:hypothetical protein
MPFAIKRELKDGLLLGESRREHPLILWLTHLTGNHRAETPLPSSASLTCSALLEAQPTVRRALPTLSAILLGLMIRPNLQDYLVMPTWLSNQEYSKALSRIWS